MAPQLAYPAFVFQQGGMQPPAPYTPTAEYPPTAGSSTPSMQSSFQRVSMPYPQQHHVVGAALGSDVGSPRGKRILQAETEQPVDTADEAGVGREGVAAMAAKHRALAANVLIGDLFHNFFDGVVIALAFRMCGSGMGWVVTGTAVLHELPQEMSDFIILVEAGL